jgi:DNA-binding response OmpR family regulator
VDNHIASLRSKLEVNPAEPRRLLTVHGVGYRLVV